MADKKSLEVRNLVVSMLTGFAGTSNGVFIPWAFFKWTNRNHPLAVFFSQAIYWHGKTDHPEKWFARTLAEWDEETGLGRAQLERAAVILEQVGLQRMVKRSMWHNWLPVVHYRFDEDMLFEAAQAFFQDGKTLVMTSTEESRKKLKDDKAARRGDGAEKRKGQMNVERKGGLNATLKRETNVTRKGQMNAERDSYIESSKEYEESSEETLRDARASAAHAIEQEAQRWESLGKPEIAANVRAHGIAESYAVEGEAQKRTRVHNAENATAPTTTPPTPVVPAPRAATPAGLLADALGLKIANGDGAIFGKTAKKLNAAGITCDEFPAYVAYWRDQSQKTGQWAVTVTSLVGAGRMSAYIQQRDQSAHEEQARQEREEAFFLKHPHLRPKPPVKEEDLASLDELNALYAQMGLPTLTKRGS